MRLINKLDGFLALTFSEPKLAKPNSWSRANLAALLASLVYWHFDRSSSFSREILRVFDRFKANISTYILYMMDSFYCRFQILREHWRNSILLLQHWIGVRAALYAPAWTIIQALGPLISCNSLCNYCIWSSTFPPAFWSANIPHLVFYPPFNLRPLFQKRHHRHSYSTIVCST